MASSTNTRAGGSKNQIIAMLKADHKKVKKAFKDFQKIDPKEDADSAEALVSQTLAEIEVHASLEEQIFYPAARSAIKEEDLIDEAEVEHMTAKVLIEQLKGMSPDDEKFAATFKVLGEYIDHHVKEEEGQIFKQITRAGVDWDSVLEEIQTQRMQLLEEKGLPAEEQEVEATPSRARASHSTSRSGASRESTGESRPQAASRSSKSSKPSSEKE